MNIKIMKMIIETYTCVHVYPITLQLETVKLLRTWQLSVGIVV